MGCVCCGDKDDKAIKGFIETAEATEALIIKLLLLGPGATGKSTLFKSLQILHSGHIEDTHKKFATDVIRQNIIIGIGTLLTQSGNLFAKDPSKYSKCEMILPNNENEKQELESAIALITKYHNQVSYEVEMEINYNELSDIAKAVSIIWNLPNIKETFNNHGRNFAFSDNLDYFFDNVNNIMNSNYEASDDDCLRNRTKTTGMNQYVYCDEKAGSTKFRIVDVGGQRSERRKWIQYFDNVQGLVFVSSLIDYNEVLYEDDNVNAMKEALDLFSETTRDKAFSQCEIILILNKDDLLEKLLLKTPNNGLYDCFNPSNWDALKMDEEDDEKIEYWDTNYDNQYLNDLKNNYDSLNAFKNFHDTVIGFILNLFLRRNNDNSRIASAKRMYHHITVATSNIIVESVFNDIQAIMVNNNLKKAGLIPIENEPYDAQSF